MNNKKIATLNIIAALFLQAVAIISGFILPRLILSTFGSEVNGLVSSLNQFLNYISLFEGGVNMVIMSSLYKPLAENDQEKVSSIVKAADQFYKKLGFMFIIYAMVISLGYPLIVKTEFSFFYVFSLSIILSFTLFIQYMFSITYRTLLTADRKGYIVYFSQSAFYFINLIACVIVLKIYPQIHLLKLVSAIAFALQPLLFSYFVKKYYKINKHAEPDRQALKQKWDGFGQNFALFIHDNTDVVILTLFSTLKNVSIYSIYHIITNAIKTVIVSVSNGILPSVGNVYVSGDSKEANQAFDYYVFVVYEVNTFIIACSLVLLIPFVRLYTTNVNDANYVQPLFGFLLLLAYALECFREPFLQMTYIANRFKQTTKYAFIEAALNIIISLALVIKFGLIGVAAGTAISVMYRLLMLVYYNKKHILHRPIYKFILEFGNAIIVIAISYLICSRIIIFHDYMIATWVINAIKSVFVVAIICVVDLLMVNRKNLVKLIGRRRNKR